MAGPAFLKSDFGARNDFENFTANNGFTVGGFYYLTFVEDYESLQEHFKIRLEASYTKYELQHYGKYVDNTSYSLFTRQLRAMRGEVNMGTLGVQIEYFPFKVDDYARGLSIFSPYIGIGGQANSYSATVTSKLGTFGTASTTPTKYRTGAKNDDGIAASVAASAGTRIKLSEYHAIALDFRLQYFFSDWVDGVNPDPNIYTENKSNDWSTAVTVGYIYYIN